MDAWHSRMIQPPRVGLSWCKSFNYFINTADVVLFGEHVERLFSRGALKNVGTPVLLAFWKP